MQDTIKEQYVEEIKIVWHWEDIREIRPDWSKDQCCKALWWAERKHDATQGINWDSLEAICKSIESGYFK